MKPIPHGSSMASCVEAMDVPDCAPSGPSINSLPPDVLQEIFLVVNKIDNQMFLCELPLVCNLWMSTLKQNVRADLRFRAWTSERGNEVLVEVLIRQFSRVRAVHDREIPHSMQFNVADKTLDIVATGCPLLSDVNLQFCTNTSDFGLAKLVAGSPLLSSLNIKSCSKITDVGLQSLAESRCCPLLTSLNKMSLPKMSDLRFMKMTVDCRNLTHLFISFCTEITDKCLEALAAGCPLLSKLDISECYQLTDVGITRIVESCHLLIALYIDGCAGVTHGVIMKLATCCPKLEYLDISFCEGVTDYNLERLAFGCPCLDNLYVVGCSQLSDDGIRKLAKSPLRYLDAMLCGISTVALEELAASGCFVPGTSALPCWSDSDEEM